MDESQKRAVRRLDNDGSAIDRRFLVPGGEKEAVPPEVAAEDNEAVWFLLAPVNVGPGESVGRELGEVIVCFDFELDTVRLLEYVRLRNE